MSGLSVDDLIGQAAEAVGFDPDEPAASAGTTSGAADSLDIPDDTPGGLARILRQATDRSSAHHAFVIRCVAHGLDDNAAAKLIGQYRPSIDKYGNRVDTEARRSLVKARKWFADHPDAAQRIVDADAADDDGALDASLQPVDLLPVLAGEVTQPKPTVLRRHDGRHLFFPGQVNGLHGDSGTGKGWVLCHAVADELAAGNNVMYLDLEDVAASIVGRLIALGATTDEIAQRFTYIRPTVPLDPRAVHHLVGIIDTIEPTLLIVDSLGEAFGLEGIDENKDAEVGPWLRAVARTLADAGPAVVLVDHSTKANDNPLHPSGSKRKRAAIGGASYLVTATKPLGKGRSGRLKLTCAKDRHGNYARAEVVAHLTVDGSADGIEVRTKLWAPDEAQQERELPVELVAREAVRIVAAHHQQADVGPLSKTALRSQITTKCGTDIKRGGIDLAIDRGWIKASEAGTGKATHLEPGTQGTSKEVAE